MHPFEVMAEPARRRIVEILASGEHTAGEIAAVVGHEYRISRTAVSKHLRVLRDAHFVDVRADYPWRYYRLLDGGIRQLEVEIRRLRRMWKQRIGWDEDAKRELDPLAHPWSYVKRRGPGRPHRRGKRGRQVTAPIASEPDRGMYPASAPPDC